MHMHGIEKVQCEYWMPTQALSHAVHLAGTMTILQFHVPSMCKAITSLIAMDTVAMVAKSTEDSIVSPLD